MNDIKENTLTHILDRPTSNTKSFIEVQFPVSKVSKESFKERKAGQNQTLTAFGKWWGRKPLILVRTTILGLLMPASSDPKKDRDIFLKILMMDENGLWLRKNKLIKNDVIIENLTTRELKKYFEVPVDLFSEVADNQDKLIKDAVKKDTSSLALKKGLSKDEKEVMTKLAFSRLTYDNKLEYCLRPEEIILDDESVWDEINNHLETKAKNLSELIRELGIKKFGKVPTVGDCFSGGGSIPFEAARIGCEAYASDLNPIACLLSWASINILSLNVDELKKLKDFQEKVFDSVAKEIDEWGIEKNEKGWMAKYYLYCQETVCPHCKTKVPLSPTWWVSQKTNTIAFLKYNKTKNNFDIDIISNATKSQIEESQKLITIKDTALYCPNCKQTTDIAVLRRDNKDEKNNTVYGLREWESHEFVPRQEDVFQERLYAIKYLEKNERKTWEQFLKKPGPATDATYGKVIFVAPDKNDLEREEKVVQLLEKNFIEWQEKGYIPSSKIERGYNTDQPIRERGWKYWHQLFNPRQILLNASLLKKLDELADNVPQKALGLLSLNRCFYYASKLCLWDFGGEKGQQTFYNQALNTLFNYACRGIAAYYNNWVIDIAAHPFKSKAIIEPTDARVSTFNSDIWITDPPYADAVNYHELADFFLSWDKKFIEKTFPEWYTDSKRVLAVKGTGESFNKSMVEIYKNLAQHMPDNGMQVVMFTHQSPAVWADLTLILWSAGLHVTAAWNIATETESGGLKEGNYVKGTVLMVLRKLTSEATTFPDEVNYEISEEVRNQIDSMRNLDDKEDPNFNDADYLLAAYAASLKVLTSYKTVGGIDVEYELAKPRDGKTISAVEGLLYNAIKIAYDYLIPASFDSFIWKNLSSEERFYIKGIELEKSNVHQLSAYQELARGFGVKEFKNLLASTKANTVRFKTPLEFGTRFMRGEDLFSNSLMRQVLMAISTCEKEGDANKGKAWLKNELENYWEQRTTIITLLEYLATTEHLTHMQHWDNAAQQAKYLAQLVKQDGV